jgi:hypothetical protein
MVYVCKAPSKSDCGAVIPVARPEEPENFDAVVRRPGNEWLAKYPGAASGDYYPHWRKVSKEVQEGFNSRCAYLGCWTPSGHVDHFVAKAQDKTLTYEWSNYRYAADRVNILKGNKDFLDPFTLQAGWIDIDPVTRELFASDKLPAALSTAAETTLKVLNDDELVRSRRKLPEAAVLAPDFFPLLADAMRRAGLAE